MSDLVTAVIPTHLRPQTLRQTLISVAAQRGVDLEIIVVDDANDPRTHAVVNSISADRIKVIANEGTGSAAGSRNLGIEHAAGRWVAFCDDDDLWAPDKLRLQLEALEQCDGAWSCTGAVTVGPDLMPIGHERLDPDDPRRLRDWNLIPGGGSSVMASAELLRECGGFDEALPNMEDWELWIRLGDHSPVVSVDRPLVAYRLWPASKSAQIDGMRQSARLILGRHAEWPPDEQTAYDLEWYIMWKLTNADLRLDAARLAAQLAIRHRNAKCAIRAGALLASPSMVRWQNRRQRAALVPAAWRTEIEGWLPDVRAAVDQE